MAGLGLNCYLQMLLKDNFSHAELHPGMLPCATIFRRDDLPRELAGWGHVV